MGEPRLTINGLKPYQIEDARRLYQLKRALLASEVGSGKTVTSLAAIDMAAAYPLVVVTVKNGRLSWAREARYWLEGRRSVTVLDGTGKTSKRPFSVVLPDGSRNLVPVNELDSDIIILNYDVLYAWIDRLLALNIRAVVYDESHKMIHAAARRTKAALRLAAKGYRGDPIPYRFCLTATPILGRPIEFLPQLQLLNRLKDVGGYLYYTKRVCAAKEIEVPVLSRKTGRREWRKIRDLSGADPRAVRDLRNLMATTFMVRREAEEIMPWLEPLRRITVPVELSNRAEYERAERDFLEWVKVAALEQHAFRASLAGLSSTEADLVRLQRLESIEFSVRASEALVKLNYLRQLTGIGKIEATIEWIKDFLEQGNKLLVFPYHREVQRALLTAFPETLHILQEDSPAARHASEAQFQNDSAARLMILSQGAAENLTLTAAHHVLFPELNWTPAVLHQAIGRARGRQNDPHNVTAYYLIAHDSNDEPMSAALGRKELICDALVKAGDLLAVNALSVLDDVKAAYVRLAQQQLFPVSA